MGFLVLEPVAPVVTPEGTAPVPQEQVALIGIPLGDEDTGTAIGWRGDSSMASWAGASSARWKSALFTTQVVIAPSFASSAGYTSS